MTHPPSGPPRAFGASGYPDGMSPAPVSRRCALSALGASVASAGALAGCGAPSDQGFGNADPVKATSGSVPLSELPENATTLVNFGGQQPFVVIVRGKGEDLKAFSAYCTHHGCAVTKEKDELDCPCHGSRFDASSGEVLRGPAQAPLPAVKVTVSGGTVTRVR